MASDKTTPKIGQDNMGQDDIDASSAPLLDHLTELRSRLIKMVAAFVIGAVICIPFLRHILDLLDGHFRARSFGIMKNWWTKTYLKLTLILSQPIRLKPFLLSLSWLFLVGLF